MQSPLRRARFDGLGILAVFAAPFAIGDGNRIRVHHRGLNARPRAHVNADLFAQEPAKDKGRRGQNCDGDIGRRMCGQRNQINGSVGASVK